MNNCIFCKIIKKEISADIVYEDNDMIIIKDIHPHAMLHYLIIPKSHYALLSDMKDNDGQQLLRCMEKFASLSKALGFTDGFRLIINQGMAANQTVKHLHIHALGGEMLEDF